MTDIRGIRGLVSRCGPFMKICKVPEAISGLNRFWGRYCLFVAVLLLAELAKATVPTAQAGEKDDVEALLQLENDMAQA